MLRAKDGSARDPATKTPQWAFVAAVVLLSVGATAVRSVAEKPDEADQPRVASRIVERPGKRDGTIVQAGQGHRGKPVTARSDTS